MRTYYAWAVGVGLSYSILRQNIHRSSFFTLVAVLLILVSRIILLHCGFITTFRLFLSRR